MPEKQGSGFPFEEYQPQNPPERVASFCVDRVVDLMTLRENIESLPLYWRNAPDHIKGSIVFMGGGLCFVAGMGASILTYHPMPIALGSGLFLSSLPAANYYLEHTPEG